MRQSKAIPDYINREEIMSLSLQNSTKIAIDEKICGYWLIRASALSEQEIAGIRIAGLSAVKKAIQHTIVSRRRGEVRDDRREQEGRARDKTGSAGDNFRTLSHGEESELETDLASLDEQDLWCVTDDKAGCGAMVGLREARKKLQHATRVVSSQRARWNLRCSMVTTCSCSSEDQQQFSCIVVLM